MKILLTIKAILNYLYNNLIDLVWVKKIKFEDDTEINTKPLNLFDIKIMSEAIANKNWCCISDTQPKRLNKADVPTAYEFLKEKLDNVDGEISSYSETSYISGLNSYAIIDDYVYIAISNEGIYKTSYANIGDKSSWIKIHNTTYGILATAWDYEHKLCAYVTGNSNPYKCYIFNFETGENIAEFNVQNTQDYSYILSFFENCLYVSANPACYRYNLNNSTYEIVYNSYIGSSGIQFGVSKLVQIFAHTNNYYYFNVTTNGQLYAIRATNILDVSTYDCLYFGNPNYYFRNGFSCVYNNKLYNKYNYTPNVYIDLYTDTIIQNSPLTTYLTKSINKKYFGYIIETYNDNKLIYTEDFNNYTELYTGLSKFCDSNGSFVIVQYNGKFKYTQPNKLPTVYTDTINGIDIKYYKSGDWKICTPDIAVGNDDNLQDVFEYLGYLNYWWIDIANEQITLQRNSNMWTFMYVGDDYIDSSLPSGYYYAYATKNDIPNVNIYKEKAQTIEIDTASVTIDNILANKNYVLSNNAITDITLTACETSLEETTIQFTTGSSAPTLTDNSGLVWFGGIPTLQANTTYVIVIFNKQAFYQEN